MVKMMALCLLSLVAILGTMMGIYLVTNVIGLSLVLSILPLYPIIYFLPKVFPSEIADYWEEQKMKVENATEGEISIISKAGEGS